LQNIISTDPDIQHSLIPTNSLNNHPTDQSTIIMQFSTIVLALAASASAAVIPRAALPEQGRWHVQLSKSEPKNNLYLTAKFTSPSYPDGLRNACVEDPSETPTFKRCDHVEFDFTYDSESKFYPQSARLFLKEQRN
jgi:hypothetical protein